MNYFKKGMWFLKCVFLLGAFIGLVSCAKKDPSIKTAVIKYTDPKTLVADYVSDFGKNVLEKGYVFEKYWHPKYELLGGDKVEGIVVGEDFQIVKTDLKKKYCDDEDKGEVGITVEFKKMGHFSNYDFVYENGSYKKVFCCAKWEGGYLIINTSENEEMFYFREAAIKWFEKEALKNPKYEKTLLSLKRGGE